MNYQDILYFPENLFPASEELAQKYASEVFHGFSEMRNQTAIIATIVPSQQKLLPSFLLKMESLGKAFSDHRILICDSRSDVTITEVLAKWAELNSAVQILSDNYNGLRIHYGSFETPADASIHYHKRCQQEIRRSHSYFDKVILIDPTIEFGWSPDGIASTFHRDDWDYVGSNGILYQRNGWKVNDCLQHDAGQFHSSDDSICTFNQVDGMVFGRGDDWLPMTSCFGGVGIYQTEAYLNGGYLGNQSTHLDFHQSMRRKGFNRIYLNPSQVVVYGRKPQRFDMAFRKILGLLGTFKLKKYERWRFLDDADSTIRQLYENAATEYLLRTPGTVHNKATTKFVENRSYQAA